MLVLCADFAKNLLELQEGRLSSLERVAMRLHLSICKRCQRYVEQLEQVREALAALGSATAGAVREGSLDRALGAFRRAGDGSRDSPDDEDLP